MGTTPRPKSAAFVVDLNLLNTESEDTFNEPPSSYAPGNLQARFIAYRAEKQQQLLNLRRVDDLSSRISSLNTNIVHLPTKLSRASPFKANSGHASSADVSFEDKSASVGISNAQSVNSSNTSKYYPIQNDEPLKLLFSSNVVSAVTPTASSDLVMNNTQETVFPPQMINESLRSVTHSESISPLSASKEPSKTEISTVLISAPASSDNSVRPSPPILTPTLTRTSPIIPSNSLTVVSIESQLKSLSLASAERATLLRRAFVERALAYRGVPYARKYWASHEPEFYAPLFLDCCGLVRRVLRDLSLLFHFVIGPWNQAYMFDTLKAPETVSSEEVKPDEQKLPEWVREGDLVFLEGIYHNPKARQQNHHITHVEILMADGEKTVGSRWWRGKVKVFDTFRFTPSTYRLVRYHFLSIDPWLRGKCRSRCPTHPWRIQRCTKKASDERRRAECVLNPRSLFYISPGPEEAKHTEGTKEIATAENSKTKEEQLSAVYETEGDVAADEANQCEEIAETDSEPPLLSSNTETTVNI